MPFIFSFPIEHVEKQYVFHQLFYVLTLTELTLFLSFAFKACAGYLKEIRILCKLATFVRLDIRCSFHFENGCRTC